MSCSYPKIAIAGLVLTLGLTSCISTNTNPTLNPTPENPASIPGEAQNKKKVLTTFTILADIAQNIAGDKLIIESITRIGAEIHGYEPTPSDLTKAQDADLILYNGMNLERWFQQFLGNLDNVPSVVLTEGIEPIPIAEGPYTDKPNPHAWMSPQNALIYVENIRQAFVTLDPENADTYNANAAAYSEKLKAIDQKLLEAIAKVPENKRYLVTCEGAFSYLARDYGMKEIYIWPINSEQQFTPKQVKGVIDRVKNQQIPAIFCETTVNDKGQKQVAQATGARFGGNLYVDSLSPPDGPVPTFLDLLEYDVQLITEGLLSNE